MVYKESQVCLIDECHIEYKDISKLIDKCLDLQQRFTLISSVHLDIIEKISALQNQGKLSENVKSYFKDVHTVLITTLSAAIQEYYTQVVLYSCRFQEVENNPEAILDLEYFEKIKLEMNDFVTIFDEKNNIIKSNYEEINKFVGKEFNFDINIKNALTEYVNVIDKRIGEVESLNSYNNEFSLLEEVLIRYDRFMEDALQINMNEYVSESIYNLDSFQMLIEVNLLCFEDIKKNESMVNEQIQKGIYQARKSLEKNRNIFWSTTLKIAGTVAGIAAIVCTLGMATPIVTAIGVGAMMAGATSVAFDASNMAEAYHNLNKAKAGEANPASGNWMRDEVLRVSDEKYSEIQYWVDNTYGLLSFAYTAGLGIPKGTNLSSSPKAWASGYAKGLGKETLQEAIDQQVNQTIYAIGGEKASTTYQILNLSRSYKNLVKPQIQKGTRFLKDFSTNSTQKVHTRLKNMINDYNTKTGRNLKPNINKINDAKVCMDIKDLSNCGKANYTKKKFIDEFGPERYTELNNWVSTVKDRGFILETSGGITKIKYIDIDGSVDRVISNKDPKLKHTKKNTNGEKEVKVVNHGTDVKERNPNFWQNLKYDQLVKTIKELTYDDLLTIVKPLEDVTHYTDGTRREFINSDGSQGSRAKESSKNKLEFEERVFKRSKLDNEGYLLDDNNKRIDWKPGQNRKDKVDLGHVEGLEYRKIFLLYKKGLISKQQVLEIHNDPENFEFQSIYDNRSHKNEGN